MLRLKKHICALLALLVLSVPCRAAGEEATPPPEQAQVLVMMYHSLCDGGGDPWTLSPSAFEKDLAYLRHEGYEAVFISDLVRFVNEGIPLPEKPVVLTFDDGYYNNLTAGLPLLEQYDMKMVLSVIGEHAERFSVTEDLSEAYGHLSWEQLGSMQESGRVELANHTWDLHSNGRGRKGCCRIPGEDLDGYKALLRADVMKLQERLAEIGGTPPLCFAYPFGSACPEADEMLRECGFQATLSCYEGLSTITRGDPDSLFDLRRNNRTASESAQHFVERYAG